MYAAEGRGEGAMSGAVGRSNDESGGVVCGVARIDAERCSAMMPRRGMR